MVIVFLTYFTWYHHLEVHHVASRGIITNKDLLYSTWNSVQHYVAAWMGGGFGEEWIHVYVWLSPFTILLRPSQHCLLISYTPIQNKKFFKEKFSYSSPVHLPSKKEHFDAFPVSSGKLETWSELQTVPLCWVFRLISTLENHFL